MTDRKDVQKKPPEVVMKENSKNPNRSQHDLTRSVVTGAAALVLIIALRYIAHDLIAPILLAIFLTVLLYPIFKMFRRTGRSTAVSLILMVITILLGFVLFGLFLTFSFNELSESLSSYIDNLYGNVDSLLVSIDENIQIESIISPEVITEQVQNLISEDRIISFVRSLVGSLGNIIYYMFFIPFLSILMLMQIDSMPKGLTKDLRKESPTVRKFQKFADTIIVYIIARGKVNAFTGILFAIALALIGVDFAILWGILVGVLSFIPYLGIVLASIPPVMIAFATGGWVSATLVIIAVIIVNVLAENVLDPYIQGQSNKISAVTIIIALIFWTWLLGPVGALLSVPLTVLLKLILEDYHETRWIAKIMEGNYKESADEIEKRNILQKLSDRLQKGSE